MPEAFVLEGGELSVGGEFFERGAFEESFVAFDVIEDFWFEDHEAAVDPALTNLRLLGEFLHAVIVENQAAEAGGRPHGGDRREASFTAWARGYCAPIRREVSGEAWANCNDTSLKLNPPSAQHPFGTDDIGRDIFARTIYGGQISLLIGIAATLLEVLLGTGIGALAAYYGGWVDSVLMRITEAMLSIPSLFLLIVTAKFFGGRLPPIDLLGRELTGINAF